MVAGRPYPVNLKLDGRKCAVVGGGPVALRRIRALLAAGAQVTVIAPEAAAEIRSLAAEGAVIWRAEAFSAPKIMGMFLVIIATDDEGVNRSAAWAAKATGALVNMAAPPLDLSDFTVPARLARGNLQITVSTDGGSPELSRALCRQLADEVAAVYAPWLERLVPLRREAKERFPGSAARQAFWRQAFSEEVLALVRGENYEEAEALVRDAIGRFGAES